MRQVTVDRLGFFDVGFGLSRCHVNGIPGYFFVDRADSAFWRPQQFGFTYGVWESGGQPSSVAGQSPCAAWRGGSNTLAGIREVLAAAMRAPLAPDHAPVEVVN